MNPCTCNKEKEIQEIHDSVKRMETLLLGINDSDSIIKKVNKNDERIEKLRLWKAGVVAIWGVVISLFVFFVGYVPDLLSETVNSSVKKSMSEYVKSDDFDKAVTDVMDKYEYTLTK